jgi:regulatory protein
LRSEKELSERLIRKKFPKDVVSKVVSFLKEKRFLDDKVFAKIWVNTRLNQPLGFRRIRQELKLKGIENEVIEGRIEEARKNYSEEEIVKDLASLRLSKLKSIEPVKARNRTFAYLIRRGFSPEIIIDVLNSICKQIS